MTPWRPGGIPDWKDLQKDIGGMWTNLSWVRNVFVDNQPVSGLPKSKQPLSSELEALTQNTCSICDAEGLRPYPSHRSLMRHVENAHHKHLCKVCLTVSNTFHSRSCPDFLFTGYQPCLAIRRFGEDELMQTILLHVDWYAHAFILASAFRTCHLSALLAWDIGCCARIKTAWTLCNALIQR